VPAPCLRCTPPWRLLSKEQRKCKEKGGKMAGLEPVFRAVQRRQVWQQSGAAAGTGHPRTGNSRLEAPQLRRAPVTGRHRECEWRRICHRNQGLPALRRARCPVPAAPCNLSSNPGARRPVQTEAGACSSLSSKVLLSDYRKSSALGWFVRSCLPFLTRLPQKRGTRFWYSTAAKAGEA